MPSIVAVTQSAQGRVRLEIDWQDDPDVWYSRVRRGVGAAASASSPLVRLHGEPVWYGGDEIPMQWMSDGIAVLYDTEAPLDVPLYYRLESAMSSDTATAGPVTIVSDGACWLKDPLRPYLDRPVVLDPRRRDPACDTTPTIYFVGQGGEQYESGSTAALPGDGVYPVVGVHPRHGVTSSLILATRMLSDRDAVNALLASGSPLLWQAPAAYGFSDKYLDIRGVKVDRLGRDQRKSWRTFAFDFAVVERPEGTSYGVDGARWVDACDVYATWGAITAAGKTWFDALQGEVG